MTPMRSWVLRLPAHGRLVVGTDLQGNLGDFEQLHRRFVALGDDAHLVLTGDLVHGPADELLEQWPDFLGTPYRDESPALIEAFEAAREAAPGRVHCLMGNHDHAHLGGPVTSKFHADEAGHLEARLGPARTERWRALVGSFPLAAVAPCGVVLTHAAPAATIHSVTELEGLHYEQWRGDSIDAFFRRPVLGPLLWARGASDETAQAFLSALGATVSIFGHDIVREGFVRDGARQVCVSTSFGCFDAQKTYVELDLASHYADAAALRDGVELKHLYEA